MTSTERPLRADAERNRRAIICAAGDVFAREGTAVTLEHIAEAAGVGIGTIYRRFRTVQDIVAVVFEEKMRQYADRAEAAVAQAEAEPWEAFRSYVMFLLEQQAKDLAFSDVTLSAGLGSNLFRQESHRALAATNRLVHIARESGAVRHDFDASDLYLLQHANAGLVRGTQRSAPLAWKRFGEYMLQAFRTEAGPLEAPPTTWLRAAGDADKS